MSEFKREPRYVVFKISDLLACLSACELDRLQEIGEKVAANRAAEGKAPFDAVVVEQDWPEFEPTWAAIEARMTGRHTSFQQRVLDWATTCFGEGFMQNKIARTHRFLEEALELAQATECSEEEAHQLVAYVFGRPVGERKQEVGGVQTTLAALCAVRDIDMLDAGETELARIWTKVDSIRAKEATKPQFSPLPGTYPEDMS